jgi:nucleotide-binding universal stress UspA family protein
MDKHHGAGAIVVGIDGSKAAVTAAEWALDEAMSRTSPLRLVYVISADDDDYPPETDYAEEALRAARPAVHVGGKAVTVDTAILSGGVDSTLLHESQAAAMICVGTVGIGRIASRFLGSTAVGLVTGAHGTVTLIEKYSGAIGFEAVATEHRWVVHISGGSVGRGDLTPDREAVGQLGSPFGRAEQMPSRPEVCGDAAEGHCHVGGCGRPGRIRGVTTATPSYKGHR